MHQQQINKGKWQCATGPLQPGWSHTLTLLLLSCRTPFTQGSRHQQARPLHNLQSANSHCCSQTPTPGSTVPAQSLMQCANLHTQVRRCTRAKETLPQASRSRPPSAYTGSTHRCAPLLMLQSLCARSRTAEARPAEVSRNQAHTYPQADNGPKRRPWHRQTIMHPPN